MSGPQWIEQWHFDVLDVAGLPAVERLDDPPCMAGPPSLRRLRSLGRRPTAQGCCWYHTGDWHTVTELAIRLVGQAQAVGVTGEDVTDHAIAAARAEGVTGWTLEALASLVSTATGIMLGDDPDDQWIYEGRHRITALREARYSATSRSAPDASALPYADRNQVPTLTERVDDLRARLATGSVPGQASGVPHPRRPVQRGRP